MWRDYVQPISTITALVLSTLALVMAQFPIGSPEAKWAYIAVVIIFNVIAAGAVVYSQYYTINKAKTEAAARRGTRDQIGVFIGQGNAYLTAIRNDKVDFDQVTIEINGWASKVEDFLRTKLGDSYVLRFRSEADMPLGIPEGLNEQRLSYWRGVRLRVVNLERFSAELPH
jgi:hypothetical protein